ncbi:hypothetical protein R70723_20530 [Paenibacillus sp. FSL R7-0273]|uniref:hypothetical protein n=1 Tax=Paenibacillus sp. FSL R7-0273 TaxID=1536772 RepID=UPI0004F6569B|nr:hypothetical protein [Paenibacillus sp. FSL R7-0273]AIQ48025.1 hypothetical protein R70723_20530 [Paenibacillus sp. FSL R7-0273]OMF94423.1 hypothetical protein BK144_07780 [Paenibacillus sp. FSL R7-0273]
MFRRMVILNMLLLLFLLTACSPWKGGENTTRPRVTILAKGFEIPAAVNPAEDGESGREHRKEQYRVLIEQTKEAEIPYVQLGETVEILLGEELSADYVLTDVILLPDGGYKYKMPDNGPETVVIREGSGAFELGINPAAFLSSNTADYEPGATIRGFCLKGLSGGEQQEIFFVLRTDAGSVGPSL